MKRYSGLPAAIVACLIVVAIASVAAFAAPFQRSDLFWLSYACVWVSALAVIGANVYLYASSRDATSAVYRVSVLSVCIVYLALAFAFAMVCMACPYIPVWVALVVQAILLGACLIGCLAGNVGARLVEQGDERGAQQVAPVKTLRMQCELAASGAAGSGAAQPVRELLEYLRYSDPVSSAATAQYDEQLFAFMDQLNCAIASDDTVQVRSLCAQMEQVLVRRNALCRRMK